MHRKNVGGTNHTVTWLFASLFIIIGMVNVFFVHLVPGTFYLLLSVLYVPATNKLLRERFGFSIPLLAKVIVGVLVLWGTLAVGDMAEVLGL